MKYKPHDYQSYCIDYIKNHKIAAVILDMGLGKTSITLTAINDLINKGQVRKVLVVAPLRVAKTTWKDEIEKWDHLSSLTYSIVVGTPKQRMDALQTDADIYIINRENLQWLIEKSYVRFDFDMVVLDELSSFKSWTSKRFKAFMKVRSRVNRVVGLTGTPTSNGLMDLFAEYKCLDMGKRLGRFISQYRLDYFRPGRTNGQIVYEYIPLANAEELIYERISDITISMKAVDHLDMPELISTTHKVYMSDKEYQVYKDMCDDLVIGDINNSITAQNAAVLTGKLCQMANGMVYTDEGDEFHLHDEKLNALEDIVESANGKPLLVAYWYQHDLNRIVNRLTDLKVNFRKLNTEQDIRDWNNKEIEVALIHPSSMGHGINLQDGGNTLVWFGLTWSLELYQQTIARLWRQGQKNKTVVVEHIVCDGTVDENVLYALEHKETTQEKLIEAVKAQIGR